MATLWHINGSTPASLGLANLQLVYRNMAADTLTFTHVGAAWDGDPLYAYAATITLTRTVGAGSPVTVFVGKVRRTPRFLGTQAESLTYEVAGPWDWLERRALVQNQAVVIDPATSTVPILIPQGLTILGQSDAGTAVSLRQAIDAILANVSSYGLQYTEPNVGVFSEMIVWDEVADLTVADALVRVLGSRPDAVVWVDYDAIPPSICVNTRSELANPVIAVAPADLGGTGSYTPLESVQVTERPDLVPPGVTVHYRWINTVNGTPYLRLLSESVGAGGYDPTDENAIVRTIELAGSEYTSTVLEQKVRVTPLSAYLTESGTITSASADAFAALSRFWKRKINWLNDTGVVIQGFRDCTRTLTDTDESGATLNTALSNELIEGAITPWMEGTTLNRRGQDQTYGCEISADVPINGVLTRRQVKLSAGVMATNCSTRTYTWTESEDFTPPEEVPAGLVAAIYNAMSVVPVEGGCTLIEEECTLEARPGHVVNLTGGRTSWTTMRALVQEARADLDSGTTELVWGWPKHLGPADLVEVARANRFKRSAQRGLMRATGKL